MEAIGGQNGFSKGRSCLSQNIQDGDNVDVIYLDFTKAFYYAR